MDRDEVGEMHRLTLLFFSLVRSFSGTHTNLMQLKGLYSELVQLQELQSESRKTKKKEKEPSTDLASSLVSHRGLMGSCVSLSLSLALFHPDYVSILCISMALVFWFFDFIPFLHLIPYLLCSPFSQSHFQNNLHLFRISSLSISDIQPLSFYAL